MPYLTPETLPATFICRRLRIPNDLGFIQAVNGALLELCQAYNWEQSGAVTPEQARAAMLDMLLDTLDSECPDETPEPGEKLVFTPDASLITYAPQDPFAAGAAVPAGYVLPPLYQITPAEIPFPGVQVGDVLTDITKLPTAWPPLLPPDGYPRFRVHFHVTGPGPGEVELHLVKLPQAGLALVTLDGDPGSADFIDLTTASVLDVADLGALLGTVLDGDLVRTHIQELHVTEVGDHFIDVTFLPKITSDTLLGFGGGLRQVVLGGTAEAGLMPAPQFQLNGTHLEWRPTEAHVWLDLGDLGAAIGPGIVTTEVIELDYDDTPQLTFDAGDKKLTLQLPTGFPPEQPGILITTAEFIGRNEEPMLEFDPETKALVLGIPDKWIVGIRQNPLNPTLLQILEKENADTSPQQWTTWANIAAAGYAIAPPATPQVGASDDENKCLASKAVVEVIKRSYTEIGERVAFDVLNSWGVSHAMSVAGAGLLNLGAAMLGGGIGLGLVVAAQEQYALNPLDEPFLEQLLSMFYVAAVVNDDVVTWDIEEIYEALDLYHLGDSDQRWMNVKYLLQIVGPDGLNAAGAVYFGQVADCFSETGYEYAVDFKVTAGAWVAKNMANGFPSRVNGVGWQSVSNGSQRELRIDLPMPGGYDPSQSIDSFEIEYRTGVATGINLGVLQVQGAGSSYNQDVPGGNTTSVQSVAWSAPGNVGIFAAVVMLSNSAGVDVEVISAKVNGQDASPWA